MKQATLAALRSRASAELGDDASVLDFACDYIANGGRIVGLATELGVSRPFLSGILHNLSDDATARLESARRQSAGALAEEAAEIADKTEPVPGAVAKAGLQVKTRHWLAERFDPERFGSRVPSVAVQVNVGALMLEALRQPIDKLRALAPDAGGAPRALSAPSEAS